MNRYELGIYEVIDYNETECVAIVMNGTFDECLDAMKSETISSNQYFNIALLDKDGGIDGASWDYDSEGNEIECIDFWEHFGYEG